MVRKASYGRRRREEVVDCWGGLVEEEEAAGGDGREATPCVRRRERISDLGRSKPRAFIAT